TLGQAVRLDMFLQRLPALALAKYDQVPIREIGRHLSERIQQNVETFQVVQAPDSQQPAPAITGRRFNDGFSDRHGPTNRIRNDAKPRSRHVLLEPGGGARSEGHHPFGPGVRPTPQALPQGRYRLRRWMRV